MAAQLIRGGLAAACTTLMAAALSVSLDHQHDSAFTYVLLYGGAGVIALAVLATTVVIDRRKTSLDGATAFTDFANRFAGWLKGQEIAAPPDMSDLLGAAYEDELRRDVADGAISPKEYLQKARPFTDWREWEQRLRADYQRRWRPEVARRMEWARQRGALGRRDYLTLLLVSNPWYEDLNEIAASIQRVADRLR